MTGATGAAVTAAAAVEAKPIDINIRFDKSCKVRIFRSSSYSIKLKSRKWFFFFLFISHAYSIFLFLQKKLID